MWSDLYVELKWEQTVSIKPFLLHGGSGGIGPNADTTIKEVTENRSGGEIDLLGRLVLEISTNTVHMPRVKWQQATTCYRALEIYNLQAAKKWKKFKRAWDSYSLATELNEKSEAIQVVTLLTVIGEEACEVFSTFAWTTADDSAKIMLLLKKFEEYCQPCKNVPFEMYRFNHRVQELDETYNQ